MTKTIFNGWNGSYKAYGQGDVDTRTPAEMHDNSEGKVQEIMRDLCKVANALHAAGDQDNSFRVGEAADRVWDAVCDAWGARSRGNRIEYEAHKAAGLLEPPPTICAPCWSGGHAWAEKPDAASCTCCAQHPTQ